MVRENLWQALHHLRSTRFDSPIWIDAICINQDDAEERSAQVNRMDMIYGSAKSVRVWLGQEGQQSTAAINMLEKIHSLYESIMRAAAFETSAAKREFPIFALVEELVAFRERVGLYEFFDTIADHSRDDNVFHLRQAWYELLSTNDSEWRAIASLLNRTYWSRIWIVQEYVLAPHKTLHCGRHVIDTQHVELALTFIQKLDLSKHSSLNFGVQESISRIQHSPGALIIKSATPWLSLRRTLLELLVACKDSKASEPRDKIYGLVGLAMDISEFDIKIDYSKSVFHIKLDVLRSYISLNWHDDKRKDAYKLWVALNDMLPETLASARREQEKIAQSIIDENIPTPPRVQRIQKVIREFDMAWEGCREPPKDRRRLNQPMSRQDYVSTWLESQTDPYGMDRVQGQVLPRSRSWLNHTSVLPELPYVTFITSN